MEPTAREGIGTGPSRPARSYLFVPGDQPGMLAKASGRGADALIVDLEDAVAPAGKDSATDQVGDWLRAGGTSRGGPPCWVRVNSGALMERDLRAVVTAALTGVCLPKINSVEALRTVDTVLAEAEAEAGLPVGSVAVAPLIETAAAVLDAPAIAGGPRVRQLILGEADLAAELGIEPSGDGCELLAVRTQVVLASAAAGLDPPAGPVLLDLDDPERLRRTTEALRRAGFGSRLAVHPNQVPVINEVFTPSPEAVDAARRLIERFDAAVAAGTGAFRDADGRMVDEAVVRAARRIVARGPDARDPEAGASGARGPDATATGSDRPGGSG
jgi:citrate lyase subunit beta / citryl-CoA lyase